MQIAQQIAILLAGLVIFGFAGKLAKVRDLVRQDLNSQSSIPLVMGPSTAVYKWMIRAVGITLILGSVAGILKHFLK